jgi:hypothetical protein
VLEIDSANSINFNALFFAIYYLKINKYKTHYFSFI